MTYVLELLKTALRNELIAEESAKHCTKGNGFYLSNRTIEAFDESRKLAERRIPQLIEAIDILTTFAD